MSQLLVFLEYKFYKIKRYKVISFIWPIVLIGIFNSIEIILKQEYLELVPFYESLTPYLYILFIGSNIADIISDVLSDTIIYFRSTEFLKRFNIYNKVSFLLSNILYSLFLFLGRLIIVFLPLYFIYNLSLNFLYFTFLGSLLVVPFVVAMALFVGIFILRYKEDAEPIYWGFTSFAWAIFPIGYSIMIFPENIAKYLEILIPPIAIIEEIRKLVILGYFNVSIMIYSILISILYLTIASILFIYFYNKGRKEGWLYLK